MVGKFLGRYFLSSKVAKLRQETFVLNKKEIETLFEAYERFKDPLKWCPNHGFASRIHVQILYNGLNYQLVSLLLW